MENKMETQTIQILEKSKITKVVKSETETTGCCGGSPVSNEDACCKLDEEKKAEGESGCGCNTSTAKKESSNCC
jgi:hypothetical protein